MTLTGKHILVVEDDPVLRKFIHDVLVRKKAQVETAENGVQALEKMEKGAFHLILSDLRMKEMDGLELLARVKQSKMDTEFILMTAYGSISSAVEAMRKGAFDYITKPIELEELDIVIRRVFQHQELVRENRYLKSELDKNVI